MCMYVCEPVHTWACVCLNPCTHAHVCVWTCAHMCTCVSSGLSLFLQNHQDSTTESLPSWLCLNHFPSNPPLHTTVRPMFRPPNIFWSPQWGLSINIWTLGKGQHILQPYSSHSSLYGLKLLSLEGSSGGQTTEGPRPVMEPIALRSKGSYNCQRDITRGCSRKHRGVQMTCPQVPLGALASPAGVFLAALNNSHMNWGNKKMCEITTAWVIRWAGGAPNRKPSWILFPALSISAISVALESFQGSLNSIQPSKFNKALL